MRLQSEYNKYILVHLASWSMRCIKNVIETSCHVSKHIMNALRLWNKFDLFFLWINSLRDWDESLRGLPISFLRRCQLMWKNSEQVFLPFKICDSSLTASWFLLACNLERNSCTDVFLWILEKVSEQLFTENLCEWLFLKKIGSKNNPEGLLNF